MWVNNVTWVFRYSVCYICLALQILTKKHISALVYMAIIFAMLFGVQQQCAKKMGMQRTSRCNLHPIRSRCSRALSSIDFYKWYKRQLEYQTTNITWIYIIIAKESNSENKVHAVKIHCTVTVLSNIITQSHISVSQASYTIKCLDTCTPTYTTPTFIT